MKKIIILLFILTNILFASIGQITALVGEIKISRDSKETLAKLGEKLEKKDVINSSKGAKAQITLDDNTIITIGQNSTLNIFDYAFDETKPKDSKASFGFMKGSFKSITGKIGKINKDRFKLRTKSASIGIRGTTIIGNQRMIACTDGAISVNANGVTVFVEKQQVTQTPEGQAPTPAEPLTTETLNTLEKESTGGNDNGDNTDTGNSDDGGDDEGNDEGGNTGGDEPTNPDDNDTPTNEPSDTPDTPDTPDIPAPELPEDPLPIPETTSNDRTYTGIQLAGTLDQNSYYDSLLAETQGSYTDNTLTITNLEDLFDEDNSTNGSLSNLIFDNPDTSSYSSYGTLSQTITTNNGNTYNLIADNLGEFIIGHYTDNTTNDFWYLGTNANVSNFDESKIYIYDDYKSLTLEYDMYEYLTESKIEDGSGYIYLNYLTKSLTYFDATEYEKGATFTSGKLTLDENYEYDGGVSFITKERKETSSGTYNTETGEVSATIFGSDNQGIGYDGYSESIDDSQIETSSTISGGGYLNSISTNTTTSESDITMSGTASKLYEGSTSPSTTDLTLTVNQSTGDITANISALETEFTGTVDDLTSYFIYNDLFGVANSDKDIYIIALPDEVSVETIDNVDYDVFTTVDDGSSWGYWTSHDDNISGFSTWVAGVETTVSQVNAATTTVQFQGHVLGAVQCNNDNSIDPILFNSSNYANFDFDFGGGANNFSGEMGFITENGQEWAVLVNSGTVTSTGFSSTDITKDTTATSAVGISSGSISNGKYFSENNDLSSLGANFNLVDTNSYYEAVGVIKASVVE